MVLPNGFDVVPGGALLDGQWAGGRHAPSGGGWAVRSLDAAPYLAVRGRVAERVDLDAALSPDRFAMLAMQEVQGTPGLRTVFVGPADGVDAQVGRWVFTAPADEGRRLVWWHTYWRTPDAFVELAAWAPLAGLPALQEGMRALEAAGRVSAAQAETLLFESGQQGCGPALHADRAQAIRESRRFGDAREVLRSAHTQARAAESPALSPPVGLRLSEHRAMGVLYRHAEACVHDVARAQRVCTVLEGEPRGAGSQALQAGIVACLDRDPKLSDELAGAVEAVWSAP